MRILFVTPFYPPDIGGIERMGAQLAARLGARGHDVAVLTATTADVPVREEIDGVPVLRVNSFRVLGDRDAAGILRTQRAVNDFVRDVAPDLVHAHDTPVPLWLYLRSPDQTVPLLVTLHNVVSRHHEGVGAASRQMLRRADWCTAVSQDVVDDILASDPWLTGRITLVPNGIERPVGEARPIADDAPPRFVCVGRMVPQKGFDRAVRAIAALAERLPDAALTFVGDGTERAALEALAHELGAADRVEFVGRVDPDAVLDLMQPAVAVVMPSHFEGMPLVAAEAGFARRPVIGTRAPGLSLAVGDGDTGVLVDPDDAGALVDAMEGLARDHALARTLGDAGLRRAERDWSMTACVDRYESIYTAMPDHRRRRASG